MPSTALMTVDELLAYSAPNQRVELVRGRLLACELSGSRHGEIEASVVSALSMYLTRDRDARGVARTRGRLVCGDAGFWLSHDPDTVRAPDAAYISRERYDGALPEGYAEFAPDLASRCALHPTGLVRCSRRSGTGSRLAPAWCGWSIRERARSRSTGTMARTTCWAATTCFGRSCCCPGSRFRWWSCSRSSAHA